MGFVDTKRRPPPCRGRGLPVLLRNGVARLAVMDEADDDVVHRRAPGHAQEHGGVVSELRGRLEDVRLGAVVVRLVEKSGHG